MQDNKDYNSIENETIHPNNAVSLTICIDASNISRGGGLTHLIELLYAANPCEYGISKVIVWASRETLKKIEDRHWLIKRTDKALGGNYLGRAVWQSKDLGDLARASGCDVLFVPGGSFATGFQPIVTMNQNLLPFQWRELRRYGFSQTTLRLLLLRWTQTRSIKRADGVIFLTNYAKEAVRKVVELQKCATVVIPHGINGQFFEKPRLQRDLTEFNAEQPFKFVYVSIIDVYKHQWHLVDAVAKLQAEGLPVTLDLIGPAYGPSLRRLEKSLRRFDPNGKFIRYLGTISHTEMQDIFKGADAAVFSSSCETFGQILTEYMAAGLPIACSNKSAMPELLGDAGMYFNPEQPDDIAQVLREMIISPYLRTEKSEASFLRAQEFSWERCASDTFAFLAQIAHQHRDSPCAE